MPQQYQLTQDDVAMRSLALNSNNPISMPPPGELEKRLADHRFEDVEEARS